jgi:predicted nucleic acid-binding protein
MARRTAPRPHKVPSNERSVIGITFDTGALLALERNRQRIVQVRQAALRAGLRVTVPAAVIAEWWRGRSDLREDIVASVRVEPLTDTTARLAGEAMAHVKGATVVDAIVMASAALRGDMVYTSDVGDLELLRAHFPSVRVLGT